MVAPRQSRGAIFYFWCVRKLSIGILLSFLLSCAQQREVKFVLFTDVTHDSGVYFENKLAYTEQMNPYTFRNFYNGAGVAIGDINNDGFHDIYFTGNQSDNKLFLNKGGFVFEDITQRAGVACPGVWSTGVTMADVNGDGWLDIYVCKSGAPGGANRHNELFINNGDLTFTEKSKEFGLDFTGLAVQAAFFDYDRDGDLDCYLLNNSFKSVGNFDLIKGQREIPDEDGGGNKFLRNENGVFKDFTAEANIYRSRIGFGLGITLGDFNEDGWTDIFVSNDFFERDYLYINQQDGSFRESLPDFFESISMGSMGADYADLNNDGHAELFVTEMLPDSLSRRKSKTVFEGWNKYQLSVANGYHHQVSRNVLQTRVSPAFFAEVGRFSGTAATEWSWGALLFDADNDGLRDIFVANGIYKDLLDRDYLAYSGSEENVRKLIQQERDAILKLIDQMPASQFSNYAFHNKGNLNFENRSEAWGLHEPMYSNGSAYADLDNDGDLDLVLNNLQAPAKVFRNNTDTSRNKAVTIFLSARGANSHAIGARVSAYAAGMVLSGDNFVVRGFQSSVPSSIHLGLGDITFIDSLVIRWPNGATSTEYNLKANTFIRLVQPDRVVQEAKAGGVPPLITFERVPVHLFRHRGSGLNDFDRDRLLPFMLSNEMPGLVKGDIDGDGRPEVYIGGGRDQLGVFIGSRNNQISTLPVSLPTGIALGEETKSILFDADADGDLDLYVAHGGRFFPKVSSAHEDRILINDGKGNFSESPYPLPASAFGSTACVQAVDYDRDGDLDLVVAERYDPFAYGKTSSTFVFQNNGAGKFSDVTSIVCPQFLQVGMMTDMVVTDLNSDGWQDLVCVGDWMEPKAFINTKGKWTLTDFFGLKKAEGWWHAVRTADLNKDGRPDFVLGNHGRNTFFKPADRMYAADFDGNGSFEQLFATRVGAQYYPVADRDDLLAQIPALKKKLLFYADYARKPISEIIEPDILAKAQVWHVNEFASVMLLSGPSGYTITPLPVQAQYAPVYALKLDDVDGDGIVDLIAGGNQYAVKPQFGRDDASCGWFFKGALQQKQFSFGPGQALHVKGQIRAIESLEANGNKFLLFARYDDELEILQVKH
jgi:hypothetical protein